MLGLQRMRAFGKPLANIIPKRSAGNSAGSEGIILYFIALRSIVFFVSFFCFFLFIKRFLFYILSSYSLFFTVQLILSVSSQELLPTKDGRYQYSQKSIFLVSLFLLVRFFFSFMFLIIKI